LSRCATTVGHLYSVDWTQDWTVGLDCGTGLWDWTVGLDCGTGLWDWTERKLRLSFRVTEMTQEIYYFHLLSM